MADDGAKKKARKGNIVSAILIILTTSFIAVALSAFNFSAGLEYKLYDLNFQRRGPRSVENTNVAIVAIDQQTADSLSFPFDRKHYGTLIRKLNRLGARQIIFDIDFSSVGSRPVSDSLFRAAIVEADNIILNGKISHVYKSGFREAIKQVVQPVVEVAPLETPFGLANDLIDHDGVMRRYKLYHTKDTTAYLSLSLKAYQVLNDLDISDMNFISLETLKFGDRNIPRSLEPSSTLLDYYGPAGTFPTYSFVSIIDGEYDFDEMLAELSEEEIEILKATGMMDDLFEESPFQDKIVFVGATADDLQDNKFTPFYTSDDPHLTPGVEVHGNAYQAIEDGRFIDVIDIGLIRWGALLLCILVLLISRTLPQMVGLLGSGLLLGIIYFISYKLFVNNGLWMREIPLMLAVVVSYPANLVYRIIQTQREKAMIRGMFAQYVPKKVTDALISNPELAKLGGETRRLSVLFSDIAGFTTVSEGLTPEQLVQLLNEYLTAMTNIVLENDGIIDKYEGDAVMAEFGAPVWFEDHAARACRAALGMQTKLAELREKWRQEGRPELSCRVGLNSGDMIVGNMGSEEVFDYTVMGDAVNLASRLEGANKSYGTPIMIGKGTWDDVKDLFVTRPLDLLRVKGKKEAVEVFELLAEKPWEMPQSKLEAVEKYNEGLIKYRDRDFKGSAELFAEALQIDETDSPSQVYHDRAAQYYLEPPPPEWDGVWTLTEK